MKKYRLLVVLLRTNALARKPAQKLKLTHQSANRFRRPYQVDYIASLQAHLIRRIKQIHSLNQLTGRTGITQPTHSLVINLMPSNRYNHINLTITANRAFDGNPIPSKRIRISHQPITAKRAFRGMAGLAVLYPSVVDWMYRS